MPYLPMKFEMVRLSRPEWKSPLTLSFEGLTERLGCNAASDVWDALGNKGEYIDRVGTEYVAVVVTEAAVRDAAILKRLLKDLLDARYGVHVETNSIFCGTREQTVAHNAARPGRLAAAEAALEAAWGKAETFMDSHANPYGEG